MRCSQQLRSTWSELLRLFGVFVDAHISTLSITCHSLLCGRARKRLAHDPLLVKLAPSPRGTFACPCLSGLLVLSRHPWLP